MSIKYYVLLAFFVLLAVASAAIWWYISDPVWTYTFVAAATSAFVAYFLPKILKRMSAENEAKLHKVIREGQEWNPSTKGPRERR